MAQEILGLSYGKSRITIYDSSYTTLFVGSAPLKGEIGNTSMLPMYPLETGAEVSNHKIDKPREIEIPLLLDPATYLSTFQNLKQVKDEGTLLIVETDVETLENMVITDAPYVITAEVENTIIVVLKLLQIRIFTPTTEELPPSPKDPNNSGTVARGTTQGRAVTPTEEEKASIIKQLTRDGVFP